MFVCVSCSWLYVLGQLIKVLATVDCGGGLTTAYTPPTVLQCGPSKCCLKTTHRRPPPAHTYLVLHARAGCICH